MWCWHRIRESETGLCPACRTPYGESPHQFTALEVEEVLKANKEAQAAAKRERQNHHHSNSSTGSNLGDAEQDNQSAASSDLPKDRTQLANMRVIRRNLVYAVGLPVLIASEEVLRKPEYFGQYGKIAKIVLNRAQVVQEGNDPRRASASAYVTFQHKQDTLSCILALDGFYLDNRSIRASYGTSKYCSAFIKSVRCNNPECTYLHELGATEDTFTKQEIQAGYVTSGRDVLARQQQILAEQLQEQGANSLSSMPRKRSGGGGPSGTGKASTNPVFPQPEYDEPSKPSHSMVPPPVGVTRASTTSALLLNPATIPGKLGRSSSISNAALRGSVPAVPRKAASNSALSATTAASVVAGGRHVAKESPESAHSTLTPLTPLKRNSAKSIGSSKPSIQEEVPRAGRKQGVARSSSKGTNVVPRPTGSSVGGSAVIGGDVIGGMKVAPPESSPAGGLSSLGGTPISTAGETVGKLPGGDIYTGSVGGMKQSAGLTIGSSLVGGTAMPSTTGLSSAPGNLSMNGLWLGDAAPGRKPSGVIGGHVSNSAINGSSSSELASILGVSLPTGSGSLQQSLWSAAPGSQAPSPLSALNGSAHQQGPQNSSHGLRDQPPSFMGGGSLIGGLPIGGGSDTFSGPVGGSGHGSSKNDIALLQSLLPGVNVTGDPRSAVSGNQNWTGNNSNAQSAAGVGGDPLNRQENWNARGGGRHVGSAASSSFGAIGQNSGQRSTSQGSGMW